MPFLSLLLWLLLGSATALPAPLVQTNARVMVTVVDASGQPVPGTTVQLFVERTPDEVGRCTTDAAGYCEIVAANVPTIGGAIRGELRIGEGWRNVIWRGGDFAITLQLDATGFLMGPVDFVTPVNEATLTIAAQETATPGAATPAPGTASPPALPEATGTPEGTLTAGASATVSPAATASPSTQPTGSATASPIASPAASPTPTPGSTSRRSGWNLGLLIPALIALGALGLYFYLTERGRRTR